MNAPALVVVRDRPSRDFGGYVTSLADELTSVWRDVEGIRDGRSWQIAGRYNEAVQEIVEDEHLWPDDPHVRKLIERERRTGERNQGCSRYVNKAVRRTEGYEGPGASFLSHARTLWETWPEVFASGSKELPYQHYSQLAVNSLPTEKKAELRTWAEIKQPTREELRQRIRAEVDAYDHPDRPDFKLQTTNLWTFNNHTHRDDGFDGGISIDLVANLMHYFSEPGDVVLDPMAGNGVLRQTIDAFRHFRDETPAPRSGRRFPLMADIDPKHDDIERADARAGLPFDDGVAGLAIIDPPYFQIADGKYANLGADVEEWLGGLRQVVRNAARCVRTGGHIAVVTDDVLKKAAHVPLGLMTGRLLADEGFEYAGTIYNHARNALQMGPLDQWRYTRAGMITSAVKIIQVVRR